MKKLLFAILLSISFNIYAQISEGGMPYSSLIRLKSQTALPEYTLKKLSISSLTSEDSQNPTPYRYSFFEDVSINIKNGLSETITNPQGTIWRYSISSPLAYSLQLNFDTFLIPRGAKLFIYNNDYSVIYGAFTHENMQADKQFVIADFPGSNLIVEYFEPINPEFKGSVTINMIGQAYKDVLNNEMEGDASNYIDINCEEGLEWQTEKHAVCKITFRVGRSGYLCSGALLNNTQNDGTPYFLTANHCISDSAAAKTVVAYFNFEKKTCNGTTEQNKTLIGSNLATTGSKSDFTLLLLNNNPPASFLPLFAGWDISNYQDDSNIGIHHPQGLEKKISVDNDKITTYDFQLSWEGGVITPPSSHWRISFDKGQTNEGSSGGPLFSKQKRVIGQLHGGNDGEEFYGKLNYSWTSSNAGYRTLKSFLDPTNSGTTVLNSYYPATNPPDAFFIPELTTVCLNSPIELKQNSAFSPTTISWIISPATFKFLNNTSANSAAPIIEFTESASYNIRLNVSNSNGKDSLLLTNAISAGNTINVNISSPNNSLCYSTFDSLILTGYGANQYEWLLGESDQAPFYISKTQDDTVVVKSNSAVPLDTTYLLNVILKGLQGTCSDTADTIIEFIRISNDNIAEAIDIGLGTTLAYSNRCATIEENEPIPPYDSCTGQLSWCNEYETGENIIENSVWFKFKGPSSGKASIKSLGFDNEIAVYSANSYQDILLGNYTLLGANDDESSTEPSPVIKDITVIPGKTYWVQVDGSGGGSEGSFTLTLSDKIITPTNEIFYSSDNSITIFPQPANQSITIKGENINENTDISIYNLAGQLIKHNSIYMENSNELTIDIANLKPGMYLIKMKEESKISVLKFIKD